MFEVYNVGSNTTYSVIDVVRILKSLVNHDAPVEFIQGKPSMIPVRNIDSNKIKDKLGWESKTHITDGLLKAYNWYLENADEFK